jgi:hypothetical protein
MAAVKLVFKTTTTLYVSFIVENSDGLLNQVPPTLSHMFHRTMSLRILLILSLNCKAVWSLGGVARTSVPSSLIIRNRRRMGHQTSLRIACGQKPLRVCSLRLYAHLVSWSWKFFPVLVGSVVG